MFGIKNVVINFLQSYRRLDFTNSLIKSNFSTFSQPLCIQMTQILMSSPLKKKKKPDPAILKIRIDKKRKKLSREIKRLMRHQKQLKPIDEIEIPYHLVDEPEKYARKKVILSTEILDKRAELLVKWNNHKTKLHSQDLRMIDKLEISRSRALKELQQESPELYEKAVKIDETLLPFTAEGVTSTPPIKDYEFVDGEYIDCTRKWDPPKIPEIDKKLKQQRQRMKEEQNAKENNEKKTKN